MRIGFGYDIHRTTPDKKSVMLCGVEIAAPFGMIAHSDGDIPLHALMDAMLGALALGDIGHWFPPSDDAFKDISSVVLLKRVNDLIVEKGYHVHNADLTIIAERPKCAPHILAMRTSIAEVLQIPVEDVSVKATTHEGMDSMGRGDSIAAHACVLLTKTNAVSGV